MKLSVVLPILSAGASKQKENKKGNRSVERFVASEVTNYCSDQVPAKGGTFEATGNDSNGLIKLENYPKNINCKHVVQASTSCAEIKVQLRSVVTEPAGCSYDFFRFGWAETITPARCGCFGDGCRSEFSYDQYYFVDYIASGFEDYINEMIGPDSFTIDSNTFTFYFKSDHYSPESGHVAFDWECVRYTTTTTTTTTTTPM